MQYCPNLPSQHPHDIKDYIDLDQCGNNQKRAEGGIIRRGWSAAKKIMQHMTSTMYQSFVNLTDSKKVQQSNYLSKKPSKMTIQLIRQIHRGFEPLQLSVNRWAFQEEEESKKQRKDVEQMVFNQELLNAQSGAVRSNRNRVKRILQEKLEDPKQFEWNLWKIAEDNIDVSKKRLQQMQKAQKQKQMQQKKQAQEKQKAQAKGQQQGTLVQNKPEEADKRVQNSIGQAKNNIHERTKSLEQSQQQLTSTVQNTAVEIAHPNQQKTIDSTQLKLTTDQRIQNKQPQQNKDKPSQVSDKIENPFLAPASKRLSLADLQGLNNNLIFANQESLSPSANNVVGSNQQAQYNTHQISSKANTDLWNNTHSEVQKQEQRSIADLKPQLFPNVSKSGVVNSFQNNPQVQFPSFAGQQGNPFQQPSPLSMTKKGLAPGQLTSAAIFKPNPILPQKNGMHTQSLSRDVKEFSQTFSNRTLSNDKVKQMFSTRQPVASQNQSLFSQPEQSRQNTEKKPIKSNRRGKREKQTRIN